MFRRALAAAVLVTVACGTEPDGVPGHYVLQTVSYKALPAVIVRSSTVEIAVLGGSVTLHADLSFTIVRRYRTISAGVDTTTQADTLTGTYSADGEKIAFVPLVGAQYEMILTAPALTWYVEGFTYRFRK